MSEPVASRKQQKVKVAPPDPKNYAKPRGIKTQEAMVDQLAKKYGYEDGAVSKDGKVTDTYQRLHKL